MLAHDLLWGPLDLPSDAPGWAFEAQSGGQPVVVRRAPAAPGHIAVGLRGPAREQRYGATMALSAVTRRVVPESLRHLPVGDHWPVLRALAQLQPRLRDWNWGVVGSAGFELASGVAALHAHSDLDLIVRTPRAITREQARELLIVLDDAECRVDLQLQAPSGGVALREWASGARRVLVKRQDCAVLVLDPWEEK